MAPGQVLQFSSRKRSPGRLELAFHLIKNFLSREKPKIAWTKLSVGCPEIILFRKMNPGKVGERSLMHAFHRTNTICSLSLVERLPAEYLFGLLLHEFGHIGSGGGEREADRWILDNFGIRIAYLGNLDLEWVDYATIQRIVVTATPPRLRNPRPARVRHRGSRCPHPRRPPAVPSDPRL